MWKRFCLYLLTAIHYILSASILVLGGFTDCAWNTVLRPEVQQTKLLLKASNGIWSVNAATEPLVPRLLHLWKKSLRIHQFYLLQFCHLKMHYLFPVKHSIESAPFSLRTKAIKCWHIYSFYSKFLGTQERSYCKGVLQRKKLCDLPLIKQLVPRSVLNQWGNPYGLNTENPKCNSLVTSKRLCLRNGVSKGAVALSMKKSWDVHLCCFPSNICTTEAPAILHIHWWQPKQLLLLPYSGEGRLGLAR